jgi:hypothetical protein
MSPTQRIRWAFRATAVVLGAAQVAVSWNDITPDGISYLDLARAYLRHDWAMTLNAYWGPVYSWLLAGVLGIFRPSLRWELPLVHLLQGFLLLGCVGAFEFFWGTLLRARATSTGNKSRPSMISERVMWVLGYGLFLWLITGEVISLINPDMLLSIEVLLTAGVVVRILGNGKAGWISYLSLGFLLGIGYLTKAVMFPLAFVFLAGSLVANWSRQHVLRLAGSALIFLAVTLPWIALLSQSKGRLTFSDSGRLNFAWFNYELPYVHWQGGPPESGMAAVHPTRKIFAQPPVFEFNGPLRASYPPWFDPSYWNEGMSPPFKPPVVAKHAVHGLLHVGYRLMMPWAWMAGILVIFLGSDFKASVRGALENWPLLMVSGAALGLYALTLVVSRYLVPWQLLFWGGTLAGLRGRRLGATVYWWLGLAVAGALVAGTAINVYRWPSVFGARDNAKPDYAIAEGLSGLGIRAGDKVASIGYDYQGYWAHLGRVSIVAEIRAEDGCRFWRDSAEAQGETLHRLALAGAKAVIANDGGGVKVEAADVSCVRPEGGWRRIGGSRDYVYFLP